MLAEERSTLVSTSVSLPRTYHVEIASLHSLWGRERRKPLFDGGIFGLTVEAGRPGAVTTSRDLEGQVLWQHYGVGWASEYGELS